MRPYLEKPFTKIGLVEWLKVKTLSSSPSTAKKKKKKTGVHPEVNIFLCKCFLCPEKSFSQVFFSRISVFL
jgi:hypothetical protein